MKDKLIIEEINMNRIKCIKYYKKVKFNWIELENRLFYDKCINNLSVMLRKSRDILDYWEANSLN